MGAVGVLTWAAAHGHGLASFIHNPAAATSSYLSNVTAGQLAWDLFDFALTFIPGSVFGAGAHTIARTTARDMAATRTALRQGGKKTAQATEQAAARTEAQRVAESQAAHTRASTTARPLNAQKQYKNKKVASDHERTLSGWSSDRPIGFHSPYDQEVLRVTDEMGYPRRSMGCRDHGVKGRALASHAERQEALIAHESRIGVSGRLCNDCLGWFRSYSQHSGKTWYVTDPDGTWVFRPDGSIKMPNGLEVPPNSPIPGKYWN